MIASWLGVPVSGHRGGDEMLNQWDLADGAQTFTDSIMFDKTFDEGMALVEETARYLDGKGREESRALPRKAAMLEQIPSTAAAPASACGSNPLTW